MIMIMVLFSLFACKYLSDSSKGEKYSIYLAFVLKDGREVYNSIVFWFDRLKLSVSWQSCRSLRLRKFVRSDGMSPEIHDGHRTLSKK